MFPLAKLLQASNRRYLEMVSSWDDPSDGAKKLEELSESKKDNDRRFKSFNFFSREDQQLFRVVAHGAFNINGFQNKSVRKLLPEFSPASVSRILKLLRVHGLVKKVNGTRKYYLTKLGKSVITLGLKTKELFLIPGLAEAAANRSSSLYRRLYSDSLAFLLSFQGFSAFLSTLRISLNLRA